MKNNRLERGATQLGIMDVITALAVLGVLVWAGWKQFPVFDQNAAQSSSASAASPTPHP